MIKMNSAHTVIICIFILLINQSYIFCGNFKKLSFANSNNFYDNLNTNQTERISFQNKYNSYITDITSRSNLIYKEFNITGRSFLKPFFDLNSEGDLNKFTLEPNVNYLLLSVKNEYVLSVDSLKNDPTQSKILYEQFYSKIHDEGKYLNLDFDLDINLKNKNNKY